MNIIWNTYMYFNWCDYYRRELARVRIVPCLGILIVRPEVLFKFFFYSGEKLWAVQYSFDLNYKLQSYILASFAKFNDGKIFLEKTKFFKKILKTQTFINKFNIIWWYDVHVTFFTFADWTSYGWHSAFQSWRSETPPSSGRPCWQ